MVNIQRPFKGTDEVLTMTNPDYREWLLRKAAEAETEEKRDRLLKLADGVSIRRVYLVPRHA